MKKSPLLLLAFLSIMVAVLASCSQETPKAVLSPEEAIARHLDKTYGKYNEELNARIVVASSSCVSTPDDGIDCEPFRKEPNWDTSDYFMNVLQIDRIDSLAYRLDQPYNGPGHK